LDEAMMVQQNKILIRFYPSDFLKVMLDSPGGFSKKE